MNILIIDHEGSGLDWGLRCQAAGHSVRLYLDNQKSQIGDGLLRRVPDWKPSMRWADLVFLTDNVILLKQLEPYRKRGFPIFGPSPEAAEWELDREKGQQVLNDAGVATLPYKNFSSYDKAIRYVKETLKRYVSKPSGDADKALSYVAKSPADMVFMLERWKQSNKLKSDFMLQEFVPGIEMAVGGWFGPAGFSPEVLENWEFKKLMNGDLGVATGEQGTVLRYTKQSKLADKVLHPVADALHKLNYVGYVDVNCIIDKQGNPWPLEFTMRPGWPLFQIQQALHKGDPAEWMVQLMDGGKGPNVSTDVAVGAVLSMPDYPYSKLTQKEVSGVPVYGITRANRDHIHPAEMKQGIAPAMVGGKVENRSMTVTAGDYILVASGTGATVSDAAKKAYTTMSQIEMPNSMMYRTDIGERLKKQLPELHKMGYAEGTEYGH